MNGAVPQPGATRPASELSCRSRYWMGATFLETYFWVMGQPLNSGLAGGTVADFLEIAPFHLLGTEVWVDAGENILEKRP